MPFIEGKHLDDYCRANQLSVKQTVILFLDVCDAVRQAHEGGVIHCDLKPNNILIDKDGKPRLIDFGLGHFLADLNDEAVPTSGTLEYMAPEQFEGRISVRSDIYALGVILFKLLFGSMPYPRPEGMRLFEYKNHVGQAKLPDVEFLNPGIPRELIAIIRKSLSRNPSLRYETIDRLTDDLRAWMTSQPVTAVSNTWSYRSSRWVRRNRVGLFVGLCIVSLIAITIGTWMQSLYETNRMTREHLHNMTIQNARLLLRAGNPWEVQNRLEEDRKVQGHDWTEMDNVSRYLQWEFFLEYPCLVHNQTHGNLDDVVVSPDGHWVFVSDSDGRVYLYESDTGQEATYAEGRDCLIPQGWGVSLCFLADGSGLVTGGTDGTIRIWKYAPDATIPISDEPTWTIPGLEGKVMSFAIAPGNSVIAVGTFDVKKEGRIYVIRAPLSEHPEVEERMDGLCEPTTMEWLQGHEVDLICAVHKDEECASNQSGVFIITDNGSIHHIENNKVRVVACVDESHVAVGDDKFRIFRLDELLSTGTEISEGYYKSNMTDVAAVNWGDPTDPAGVGIRDAEIINTDDCRIFAFSAGDNLLRVGFIPSPVFQESGTCIRRMGYHFFSNPCRVDLAFFNQGKRIVSVGVDGLRIWGNPLQYVFKQSNEGWMQDSYELVRSGLRAIEEQNGKLVLPLHSAIRPTGERANNQESTDLWQNPAIAVSLENMHLAGYAVSVFSTNSSDATDIQKHSIIRTETDSITNQDRYSLAEASLSPDGRYLAFVDRCLQPENDTSRLILVRKEDNESDLLSWVKLGKGLQVSVPLFWIPGDPTYLLTGMATGEVYSWEIDRSGVLPPEPELVADCKIPCSVITQNRSSSRIAIGWEKRDLSSIEVFARKRVTGSFVDQWVVENKFDCRLTLWCSAFVEDADGRELLACGGSQSHVLLLDPETGSEVASLTGHSVSVNRMVSCPDLLSLGKDGKSDLHSQLITLGRDHSLRIWDIPTRSGLAILAHPVESSPLGLQLHDPNTIIFQDGDSAVFISPSPFISNKLN